MEYDGGGKGTDDRTRKDCWEEAEAEYEAGLPAVRQYPPHTAPHLEVFAVKPPYSACHLTAPAAYIPCSQSSFCVREGSFF